MGSSFTKNNSSVFNAKISLEHPKAKVFVSHCGGNSVNEAVVDGVPVLAIPLFADQFDGATRLAARGAAIRLFKTSLTGQLIHESIMKLINDERSTVYISNV